MAQQSPAINIWLILAEAVTLAILLVIRGLKEPEVVESLSKNFGLSTYEARKLFHTYFS